MTSRSGSAQATKLLALTIQRSALCSCLCSLPHIAKTRFERKSYMLRHLAGKRRDLAHGTRELVCAKTAAALLKETALRRRRSAGEDVSWSGLSAHHGCGSASMAFLRIRVVKMCTSKGRYMYYVRMRDECTRSFRRTETHRGRRQ